MTDGIKAPWLLPETIGIVLGALLAFGFYFVSAALRRAQPLPFAIAGWLAAALLTGTAVYFIYSTLSGHDVTGISLGVGVVLLLVLAGVAGLAIVSARRDGVGWPLAFGHVMTLAAITLLFIYGVAQYLPYIAAFLRGVEPTDNDIVYWFPPIHLAADWMCGTLTVALILLEIFRPFRHGFVKPG